MIFVAPFLGDILCDVNLVGISENLRLAMSMSLELMCAPNHWVLVAEVITILWKPLSYIWADFYRILWIGYARCLSAQCATASFTAVTSRVCFKNGLASKAAHWNQGLGTWGSVWSSQLGVQMVHETSWARPLVLLKKPAIACPNPGPTCCFHRCHWPSGMLSASERLTQVSPGGELPRSFKVKCTIY